MESTYPKMRILMGEFPVVEVKPYGAITINVGKNVHITIHVGDFQHSLNPGDKVPLFTEIPYANPQQSSVE
jgi:hypothetical protein